MELAQTLEHSSSDLAESAPAVEVGCELSSQEGPARPMDLAVGARAIESKTDLLGRFRGGSDTGRSVNNSSLSGLSASAGWERTQTRWWR